MSELDQEIRLPTEEPLLTGLPLDQVIEGDCREMLEKLPAESVDLVFADPPYNLQLAQELWRPNQTLVDAVDDDWDRFGSFAEYDQFTRDWLQGCRRVLKRSGTLWVIGSYHNIYRVGNILQDLGFWILNDVVWTKANPMPNFRGVRFTNAHETLLWAQKEHGAPYTFNYQAMKALNDGIQMRSDWLLPICSGKERLRVNGQKAHPTQKPEALLYRVLLASTQMGDVVLDPFFGTGTTGAMARRLGRHFVGIERSPFYVEIARERIARTLQVQLDPLVFATPSPRKAARIPFGQVLEYGLLEPGQLLYFGPKGEAHARVLADGTLDYDGQRGSIHQVASLLRGGPANGWESWYYIEEESGERRVIDVLRQFLRAASEGES
ncbi:MAG TPA: site-specific DNA-methyltransferase [Anaerolineaceae bacterium]